MSALPDKAHGLALAGKRRGGRLLAVLVDDREPAAAAERDVEAGGGAEIENARDGAVDGAGIGGRRAAGGRDMDLLRPDREGGGRARNGCRRGAGDEIGDADEAGDEDAG